jgi:hypothetical protein
MTVRKHNDHVRDGCGDSGTDGQTFTKDHAFNDVNFGYPGQKSRERSRPGSYTDNESGLRRSDPADERALKSRDFNSAVEDNQSDDGNRGIKHVGGSR